LRAGDDPRKIGLEGKIDLRKSPLVFQKVKEVRDKSRRRNRKGQQKSAPEGGLNDKGK